MKKTGAGERCNKGNPQIDKFSHSFLRKRNCTVFYFQVDLI